MYPRSYFPSGYFPSSYFQSGSAGAALAGYQPAIVGAMRLGNARLAYESPALLALRRVYVRITIAGTDARMRVRRQGLTIRDVVNDAPNAASLQTGGPAPSHGQDVRILVNSDTPRLLFNGAIQTTDLTYEGQPTQSVWACAATDDMARLNERRPFGTWVDTSVTTIAQSVIATFAPGFTTNHVQAGLPTVSIIFDGSDDFTRCLARLAKAIGGYFYVEDLDLHLFTEEATDTPDPIQVGYRFEDDPPIQATVDRTQLITKQCGKGHGEAVLVDVAAGESIIPVEVVMFSPTGGKAMAGTTPDGAQSQILTYTGVQVGGAGSFTGPSATPGVAPALTLTVGAGLTAGVYQYAYTWVTSGGETQPSPLALVTAGASVPDPTTRPTVSYSNAIAPFPFAAGDAARRWAYTFTTAAGESLPSPVDIYGGYPIGGTGPYYAGIGIAVGPAGTTGRKLYRTVVSGSQLKLVATISDNTTLFYDDHIFDGALGANAPTSNTAVIGFQVALAGIAIGPSGVTSRKVYRTTVGGSQLKLQQTIANNTATTGVQDATADGSLGANAPISNTSGLSSTSAAGGGFFTSALVVFKTDGAATNANTASPIFTSATYTFVTADVGANVYIKSGTNWTPGFYPIVSVAAGAATLSGACATVASPTVGTWGVDYSGFTTPRFSFTDLVIDAATATKFTSAAFPVGPNFIGNTLTVTGGVGFSVQQVVVLSTVTTTATCDKVLGALSSTGGVGTLGVAPTAPYVFAGATTMQTSGAGPFSTGGGWVKTVAGDLVRYTGISGNTLTGVPASGAGALLTTIPYGAPLVPAPALTGVTGLTLSMLKGTPVSIWVQRDDLTAQATQIALDLAQGRISTGIVEGPPIVDERRGEPSLTALCDATLAKFSTPIVTVTYATRDQKTKSGKTIVVNLTNPPISQTLTIQDVTITELDNVLGPKFTATASTVRFSLEDLLRRLAA